MRAEHRAAPMGRGPRRRAPWPGLLAVAALLAVLATPAPAQDDGALVFQRCFSCHSVDPAERNLSGPNLLGVVGRRAATLPEFEYSEAMRAAGAAGLVWTPEVLDRYVTDPEDFLPAGRMAGVRLRDPAQRRVLIEWLASRPR